MSERDICPKCGQMYNLHLGPCPPKEITDSKPRGWTGDEQLAGMSFSELHSAFQALERENAELRRLTEFALGDGWNALPKLTIERDALKEKLRIATLALEEIARVRMAWQLSQETAREALCLIQKDLENLMNAKGI